MASRLLLLATLALFFVAAAGQNMITKPFHPSCSTTDNYTDGSQYKKNLDQLLAALPAAAGNNDWFYKSSAGSGADEVFGLIMCFADRNKAECLYCLSRAPAGITTVCPGSRNVSGVYNACVLRYSSAPISANADLREVFAIYTPVNGVFVTSSEALRQAWVSLIGNLTAGVALDPLRIFNSSTPYSGTSQEMYGLAQCTRDLDSSQCRICIASFATRLWNLFPDATGGAVKGYSCYLRYLLAPINITLPPLPAPAPPTSSEPSSKTGTVIASTGTAAEPAREDAGGNL